MARIFYKTDTGEIWGVHPDGNIAVPNTVSFIDVVGKPNEIQWPEIQGKTGAERTSKVDLVSKVLIVREEGIVPPTREAKLREALEELKGLGTTFSDRAKLEVLIDALIGYTGQK